VPFLSPLFSVKKLNFLACIRLATKSHLPTAPAGQAGRHEEMIMAIIENDIYPVK